MTLAKPIEKAEKVIRKHFNMSMDDDVSEAWRLLRAELHRLSEINDGYNALVIELHDTTTKLEAANELLEIIRTGRDGKKYDYVEARDGRMVLVAEHLQGAGDEAAPPTDRRTPEVE